MAKPRGRTFKDCAGYQDTVTTSIAVGSPRYGQSKGRHYVAVGSNNVFKDWSGVWLTPKKARDLARYLLKLADEVEKEG
jgi:hypothetical protein